MGVHSSDASRLRWRRARALLASGLVLGVGAAVTLAAWNDAEHSTATFTAGTFGIQGATTGQAFGDHATPQTAEVLQFQAPTNAMTPGTTRYALFSVRTIAGSVAGAARLNANEGNNTGLGQWLTYGVRTLPTGTACNQANFDAATATKIVEPGARLATGSTVGLPLEASAGSQVNYCFAITLPTTAPTGAQGTTVDARWEIVGTSS